MKVYIIGTGMEGNLTLTVHAKELIEKSDVIIGAERIVRPFKSTGKQIKITYDTDEICRYIAEFKDFQVAVLMSGDCGFFSGAKKLADRLDDCEIICGISSPVYLCSKFGLTWENMRFVSLHGTKNNIAVNVKTSQKCFFLLDNKINISSLCQTLCEYNLSNTKVYLGENLSYFNEKIKYDFAFNLINYKSDNLSCAVVVNDNFMDYAPCGISDSEFIREKIPMTKSEIRCVIASKMNVKKGDICWDIGCGTGSVSVEIALRCTSGRVFSFDKNEDALRLTQANAHKFSCDNLSTFKCCLPEISDDIPAPDKVFIGGSSGKIKKIFKLILLKNPNVLICVTAVSLETLRDAQSAFEDFGLNVEISQISSSRIVKIGKNSMFSANNPVFVLTGGKKCGES
ncbi:MAG: precorrin-6y C5,15-methyltransferase (decarboxylating) subunit CbiE [Ruminococcus sp.]|nr:precorrin-6y C5,15-methyltransferase (decarboxylating) subunit CbiE [Ruminococcus sp.]